jgi:hypothetical protein
MWLVLGCVPERFPMPFVDVSSLRVIDRLPGWHGRYFHSESMTFAHYDFVRGSSIHEHIGPQEDGNLNRPKPSALPVCVDSLQSHLGETYP